MVLTTKGIKRVMKELEEAKKPSSDQFYQIFSDPSNIQMIYAITTKLDGIYQNGQFIILIKLPDEYPLAPPVVQFKTPNGKFECDSNICLNITHFHSETWSPLLTIDKIVQSVISVMYDKTMESGVGFISTSDEQKIKYSQESGEYNKKHNANILSFM